MYKEHTDTIRISAQGVIHGIRNRQTEYSSARKKDITIAETFCGRHRMVSESPRVDKVSCGTCRRAMRADN